MVDRVDKVAVVDKPDMPDEVDRVDYSRQGWQWLTGVTVVGRDDKD